MNKGRVTIPTDDNFLKETMEIAEKWGADAISDRYLPDSKRLARRTSNYRETLR